MNQTNLPTIMAVHAHPDDESISTGGLLAKYAALGIHTVVVYGTRGEAGDILNPDFIPPSPKMEITDIRKIELDRALKVLRVGSVFYLGYRDSGMQGTPQNRHPRAFAQADLEEATGKLVRIIRQTRPQVIVTYNERGIYGHPDHIMANQVTRQAFETAGDRDFNDGGSLPPWRPAKLYYTAISRTRLRLMAQLARDRGERPEFNPDLLGTPDEKITTVIDVREFLDQKFKALFSHQSQIGPKSFFRRVPEEWKEEAFGYEHFECVRGCTSKNETDLFQDL
jgi:LmbE family N-acetylglucosaminyl deacetylase